MKCYTFEQGIIKEGIWCHAKNPSCVQYLPVGKNVVIPVRLSQQALKPRRIDHAEANQVVTVHHDGRRSRHTELKEIDRWSHGRLEKQDSVLLFVRCFSGELGWKHPGCIDVVQGRFLTLAEGTGRHTLFFRHNEFLLIGQIGGLLQVTLAGGKEILQLMIEEDDILVEDGPAPEKREVVPISFENMDSLVLQR